jgi:hypothetical protein
MTPVQPSPVELWNPDSLGLLNYADGLSLVQTGAAHTTAVSFSQVFSGSLAHIDVQTPAAVKTYLTSK